MLAVFSMFSLTNAYQWIHLGIIGNIVIQYYNASLPADSFQQNMAIDWLSLSFLVCYIPVIFPVMWLLDRKGLKMNNIAGSSLNVVGAWLKCACLSSDRFILLMAAQVICALACVFIISIPPHLAAVWFGPREVCTVTSIGILASQVSEN